MLQETSTKLKEDLERVQYVLVELVDLESRLEETNQRNNRLEAENTELKAELTLFKSEISTLKDHFHTCEHFKTQTTTGVSFEQEEINSNIIIRGIEIGQDTSHDCLLEKFNKIRSHLGVCEVTDFEATDIGILQSKNNSDKSTNASSKTIRVKFRSIDNKRRFLQVRRTKTSIVPSEIGIEQNSRKPILIAEQLTKQNQDLLFNARSLRTTANFKFVWSNNGQILARLRQGSKVIRIKDIDHINQLKTQFSDPNDGFIRPTINYQPNSGDTQA